ncbi:hypothetical protein LCGC14_2313290, partial [marine sediment metagenome]
VIAIVIGLLLVIFGGTVGGRR